MTRRRVSFPALAMCAFGCALAGFASAKESAAIHGNMLLQADEVDFDMNSSVASARGHVEIDNEGRVLIADVVSYDQKQDVVTASGHVSLMDEHGNVAFAEKVVLTDQMRNGALEGFGALIGKTGRMSATSAHRIAGQFTVAEHASYTPCKICQTPGQRTPVWQVHASRVIYDEANHKINFKNATLELLGIPIFYSPYLSEPDPTVKYATGILTPDVGDSTNIGYFARLPIYVALSESNDLTVAPLVSTHGGEVVESEYRQRWNNGGFWLQGSVARNPYGGITENQNQYYAHLFGSGRLGMGDGWNSGFDVQYTSNDTYMKRYDISLLDRLVTDVFVGGENGRSRFVVTGYYFEGLRGPFTVGPTTYPGDNADQFPYILPLIQYTLIPRDKILDGQFRFDLNSAVIQRTDGPTSERLTGEVRWRAPAVLDNGMVFTVQLDARGDLYHVNNNDALNFPTVPLQSRYISRGAPYAALDWRWPFVADTSQTTALVVEPIFQAIAQPYGGNPSGLPIEDSTAFELDENDLFSFNQLPGYDLLESGPRFNAGFRAAALFSSGSVETVWGQTYRLKTDPIFGPDSGVPGKVSDIVGRVSVKFLPYIDLTDRIDLDRANGTVRRHEVYLTGTYGRSSVQLSYVLLPAEPTLDPTLALARQEVNAQADINFYRNWQAFGALRRDLNAERLLDTEFGLGYEDECLGLSVAYRRRFITDRDLPPSTTFILRFSLKTGEKPIEPFSLFPRDVFGRP